MFFYQKLKWLYFTNDTLCYKETYPKVLTFAFAGDLVIKQLKFLKVFQDKDRLFFLFNFKNDDLYHERLLNSRHLTKRGSVISVS